MKIERCYQLRDYQTEGIEQIISLRKQGHKSILRQQPTGTGKSLEILEFALRGIEKGNEILICVPFPHLVGNLERYFLKLNIQPQIIQGNRKVKKPHTLVTIACVPTLHKRISDGLYKSKPKLVLWDESHKARSATWDLCIEHVKEAFNIFWTATPRRLDGKGFDEICTALVAGKQVKWFIEQGCLAPFRYLESPYVKEEGDKTVLAGKLVETWLEHAENYPTLVYAPSIEESKAIVDQYNEMARERYGKEIAIHLDGSMAKSYVDKVLAAFGQRVTIISTVDMVNEGADLPNCWCVQLASFSTSLSKVIQRWGRVLRYQEGKVAVILDHVGISAEHGLPDDYREWDLKGWIDPEKIKLYCYLCDGLISKDKRTISRDKIACPHCKELNYLERTERDTSPGGRGSYEVDPSARLVEVSERSQTRQIKRILKKREQQSNKAFWAVHQALPVPDLDLADFMQLCIGLGYKKGYAYRLLEIYKVMHNVTNLCHNKSELSKALGESADRYWATYCKIHGIEENV